jgi:hypothetical protein
MARIRNIKPEFFTSEAVSELPLRARLTWIGLWTHCDNHGRARDNVKLIKAAVWPLDDVSLKDIEDDLTTLAEHQRIVRYEVDGKRYLVITNWSEHQYGAFKGDPKHPGPDGSLDEYRTDLDESRFDLDESGAIQVSEIQGSGDRGQEDSLRSPPRQESARPDVDELCERLRDRVVANGAKAAVTAKWRADARLMLDRDGRDFQQAKRLIDWATSHDFWASNILSMPKFRAQYDKLLLQAKREGRQRTNGSDATSNSLLERAARLSQSANIKQLPAGG